MSRNRILGRVPENTAVIRVGRVLEIRANAGYKTVAQVDLLFDQIARCLATLPPNECHVAAVDWRNCPIMSPEAAQRMAQRIASVNGRVLRSGALARQDAHVSVLQFLRVLRDAGSADRKLFFEEAEMIAWLSEVLTPQETAQLKSFLGEQSAKPAHRRSAVR
jgi:hypothetical protein